METDTRKFTVYHLDDEPVNLSFIPRTLHLRIKRKFDKTAFLDEHNIATDGRSDYVISFAQNRVPYSLSYFIYTTVGPFCNAVLGHPAEEGELIMVLFDMRIGENYTAGLEAYAQISSKLVPKGNIEWLLLTAYPGIALGHFGVEQESHCIAKPPNRVDLFNRIFDVILPHLTNAEGTVGNAH